MKKLALCFAISMLVACPNKNKVTDRKVGVDGSSEPMQMVMYNYSFHPEHLEVPAGKDVVFSNRDAERHCLTIEGANIAQDLEPNETFSYVFKDAGEFAVTSSCDPPRMKATIVVK